MVHEMVLRRSHTRLDPRTGRPVQVRAHNVNVPAHTAGPSDDTFARLAAQASTTPSPTTLTFPGADWTEVTFDPDVYEATFTNPTSGETTTVAMSGDSWNLAAAADNPVHAYQYLNACRTSQFSTSRGRYERWWSQEHGHIRLQNSRLSIHRRTLGPTVRDSDAVSPEIYEADEANLEAAHQILAGTAPLDAAPDLSSVSRTYELAPLDSDSELVVYALARTVVYNRDGTARSIDTNLTDRYRTSIQDIDGAAWDEETWEFTFCPRCDDQIDAGSDSRHQCLRSDPDIRWHPMYAPVASDVQITGPDQLVVTRPSGERFTIASTAPEADFADLANGLEETWARWRLQGRLQASDTDPSRASSRSLHASHADACLVIGSGAAVATQIADHPGTSLDARFMGALQTGASDPAQILETVDVNGTMTVESNRWGDQTVTNVSMVDGPDTSEIKDQAQAYAEFALNRPDDNARDLYERQIRYEERVAEVAARHDRERARAQSVHQPETIWSDNLDAVADKYTALRAANTAGEPVLTYEKTAGVLGGTFDPGRRGFGLEIEYEFDFDGLGEDPDWDDEVDWESVDERNVELAEALHSAGLIPNPYQTEYHDMDSRQPGMWAFEYDSTVHGELISPILHDTPEAWEQIERACDILRAHGAKVTTNCGGHIHVGVGDYDHDPETYKTLVTEVQANEDFLYRAGTNPERGLHRNTAYSDPLALDVSGYSRVEEIAQAVPGHSAVAMSRIGVDQADHVEFRFFDGSLDPAVIQTRLRLAGGMVQSALAGRNTRDAGRWERLGDARAQNPSGERLTGDVWRDRLRRPAAFLDSVFHRDEDKQAVLALWASNRNPRTRQIRRRR